MERVLSNSNHITLAAKTVSGLHEAALHELVRYVTAPSNVLDLGAGTGAWAARLLACGHHVTCVDRDGDAFALDDMSFMQADLNGDFSKVVAGPFAAITAIEVIEHLENPRHFLLQCRNLLSVDGVLLITTPNIECVAGRLRFLLTGNFRMFDRDERLNDPTHISPIQSYMFEKMLNDTGLRVLSHATKNPLAEISGRLSRFVCSVVNPFLKGIKGGDNHIFILAEV